MEASTNKLSEFKALIQKGQGLGLNMTDIVEKFESTIKRSKDDIIRIVMLGAFSDGKTSVIAGLLGKVEDNMKIDTDESSDDLTIYRPDGLKKGYEIVDTPGLFGSKSKEIDGKEIKYSDITRKYISEAHIVIYVTDAVNPLKESHRQILKLVLRDFNKLGSSIFVINKMDEAGVDMSDDSDYKEAAKIKQKTFIERLNSAISLTPKEKQDLRIACVASNPNNRGLDTWLRNENVYLHRSHIDQLRNYVTEITNTLDREELKVQVDLSVIKDLILQLARQIALTYKELENPLVNIKNELDDLEHKCDLLKSDIAHNKGTMTDQIQTLKNSLLNDVTNAKSTSELSNIIDSEIGRQGDETTCYVLVRKINQILSICVETNNTTINTKKMEFELSFNHTDNFLKNEALKASKYLGKINISGNMVKSARDIFAQSHKFKPYGAINLGSKITKTLGKVGTLLGVIFEIRDWHKAYREQKELDKGKKDLNNGLNDIFADIFAKFDEVDDYYLNFAPTYLELRNQLNKRRNIYNQLKERNEGVRVYKGEVEKWYGQDIEDAEYEEI